jgi:hypothetical protein
MANDVSPPELTASLIDRFERLTDAAYAATDRSVFSKETHRIRKTLLIAGAISLFIGLTGAYPTNVQALGMTINSHGAKATRLFLIGINAYLLVHFIAYGLREFLQFCRDHNRTAMEVVFFQYQAQAQIRQQLENYPDNDFLHSALLKLGDSGLERSADRKSLNELIANTFFENEKKFGFRDAIARQVVLFLEGILPILISVSAIVVAFLH